MPRAPLDPVAVDRGDVAILKQKTDRFLAAVERGEEPAPSPCIKSMLRAIGVITHEVFPATAPAKE